MTQDCLVAKLFIDMQDENINSAELIENIFHNFHVVRRVSDSDSRCSIRKFGISTVQAGILMTLLHHGPKTMSQLSSELTVSKSATTQLLDKLVKDGLVERVSDADDGRVTYVQLTDLGVDQIHQMRDGAVEKFSSIFAALSREELLELNKLTDKLAQRAKEIG